jgi:hypothetical protein
MNAQSRPDFRSTEAHQSVSHQTEPDRRLLRVRAQRPGVSSATDKYDEFPSPHGIARAEGSIGYKRISHFWIEDCEGHA